jgi:hypothetical protein
MVRDRKGLHGQKDIMRKDKIRQRHDWLDSDTAKAVTFYKIRQYWTGQDLTRKNGWVV